MFAAEIHGKSSLSNPAHIRSEDLLTSHVFSAFHYINNSDIIKQFLNKAKNESGTLLTITAIDNIDIYFWPKFHFKHSVQRQREADALLIIESDNDNFLMFVEAKLDSGLSNVDVEPEEQRGNVITLGNQLADEFCGLYCGEWNREKKILLTKRLYKRILLYVTNHYEIPLIDIKDSCAALINNRGCRKNCMFQPEDNIYWVSWRELSTLLEDLIIHEFPGYSLGEKRLLIDLLQSLKLRDLSKFNPFKNLNDLDDYEGSFKYFENILSVEAYKSFI